MKEQNKNGHDEELDEATPKGTGFSSSEGHSRAHARVGGFGSLRRLCFAAILAAMSLVLGKFLQIPHPFQEFIRISFENLPVLLAGLSMGPVVGALVGAVADLLGCVLYGYSINPIVTLGAASVGLVSGFLARYVVKKSLLAKVTVSVSLAHLVGSVFIKSAGLAAWYLAKYELGYLEFLGWRCLNYLIVGTAECVLLYLLLHNRAFAKQIKEMCKYDV
ncbi:MAG: folate family ECF transporter S component [Clostridia bacterium]|nr:folate family ECF transporter S component [Clostridia bacterium]